MTNTTLEVNYIGTKGTNLLMRRNIAQALEYSPDRPTVAERKPYPNFVVYIDSEWGGRSRYDAFNTKLEHRGRGSLLTLAYTWAKSTDTKSAAAGIGATGYNGWQGFLNNHDPERDYGLSDFDVDHRLVGSFVYNIPVGSGERFATRRDRREERHRRRLAAERHLHLAARVSRSPSRPQISAG